MAEFKTDLNDIFFGLFEVLKVQKRREGAEAQDYQDLKEIISEYNKFTANEIWPTRSVSDREGVKMEKDGVKVSKILHAANQKFYQNGWFSLGLPEAIGGMPVLTSVALACNSISTGSNVGFMMYTGLTKAALSVIWAKGSEEQKQKYIPSIVSGEWGGTMCLTESGAGSDVGACRTSASPIADGKYAIKGVKIFISSGESDLYKNNIHLVLAKTPNAPEGSKGLSLFIVPRFNLENQKSNNVICTKVEEKMGIHASATCELTFGRDGECVGELIGAEFEGMANMFIMMNEARLLCGMQGESQANLVYGLTEQYAKERVQFGKEIVHHPDVARMLLKIRAMSRGMRALNFYVGNLFDEAKTNKEVEHEIALLTPICKSYCSEKGFEVCVEALQIHGGYGYCTEYGIEQFVRDTKIATIYEGTNGIQAIDFLMRKILKDQGKTLMALSLKINASLKSAHSSTLASSISEELNLFKSVFAQSEKIMAKISELAKANKQAEMLGSASDILDFFSQIVVAWQLLDHALTAQELLSNSKGEMKKYYETKIIDFRIYTRHFLTKNLGLVSNILNFKDNLLSLEL